MVKVYFTEEAVLLAATLFRQENLPDNVPEFIEEANGHLLTVYWPHKGSG